MAVIIVVRHVKGGQRKTTTTEEVAGELALNGKRVLIVDMDYTNPGITEVLEPVEAVIDGIRHDTSIYRVFDAPSLRLGIDGRLIRTVDITFEAKMDDGTGHLMPRYPIGDLYRAAKERGWQPGAGRLDYLPGDFELGNVLAALPRVARDQGIDPGLVLLNALKMIEPQYDYILIDTPPSQTNKDYGLINVLNAADAVICPLDFTVMAQAALLRTLSGIRSFTGARRPNLVVLGIVLCAYKEQNARQRAVLNTYRQHPDIAPHLFGSIIPYAADLVDDAHESRVLPQMFAPIHSLSSAIHDVTQEVISRAQKFN